MRAPTHRHSLNGAAIRLAISIGVAMTAANAIAVRLFGVTTAEPIEVAAWTVAAGFAVVLGYPAYFWIQRHARLEKLRTVETSLDRLIPFVPDAVFVYSILYYCLLLAPLSSMSGARQATLYVTLGAVVVFLQGSIAYFHPTAVPIEWRRRPPNARSRRLMTLVREHDMGTTCFPSLHTALAVFAGAAVEPAPIPFAILFGLVTATSCVLTKQHSLIDIPAGATLGAVAGLVFRWLAGFG